MDLVVDAAPLPQAQGIRLEASEPTAHGTRHIKKAAAAVFIAGWATLLTLSILSLTEKVRVFSDLTSQVILGSSVDLVVTGLMTNAWSAWQNPSKDR
jgi:hypothetical protein